MAENIHNANGKVIRFIKAVQNTEQLSINSLPTGRGITSKTTLATQSKFIKK